MVVSVGVSFAKIGAYFFIRHPVDDEFSLNIPGNLWSTSFYEGRTNYVSLPTYPAASLMYVFMLFVAVHENCISVTRVLYKNELCTIATTMDRNDFHAKYLVCLKV